MAELLQELNEKIKALGGDWTKYTVVGSFVLYVLGYLTLRFHLTAMGIGTDLAVLDERYLFTGARFVVFLVATIPNLLLGVLPVALVLYLVSRMIPRRVRGGIGAWLGEPRRLAWSGIVLSLLLIQLLMRKCFLLLDNLLLARQLPSDPEWLVHLLYSDSSMAWYFAGLVAGCIVCAGLLWASHRNSGSALPEIAAVEPTIERVPRTAVFATSLLALLVAIQFLLLPINYGVLIADKSLPRVASIGDKPLAEGESAWLVWEGKDGITWLVRGSSETGSRRSLVTLPRADVKRIEIVGYDRILPTLFPLAMKGSR